MRARRGDREPPSAAQARWRVVGVGLSFGMGLAIQGWLFGVVIGGWLDQRFATAHWCLLGGVMLALILSFIELYRVLIALEKAEKREQARQENEADNKTDIQ